MRRLWLCDDWGKYVPENCRKGVRLKFEKGVDEEVVRACKEFVAWLRKEYEFPIRVPIYFKNTKYIKSQNGQFVSAIFLGPYDKSLEPYIRIAVDDYYDMLTERGKDNALASILHSVAHELSHYFQWLKDLDSGKLNIERQAKYYADEILLDYAETREHP